MVSLALYLGAAAVIIAPITAAACRYDGGDVLVQLGPADVRNLTFVERAQIIKSDTSYFDLTSLFEPPLEDLPVLSQTYPTKMVQQRETRNLINGIDRDRMMSSMETLINFENRHYQSEHGVAASEWVYQELKRAPGAMKLGRFRHDWSQNSIELQISEGRSKKKKTIIVGAHLDAMNKFVAESERGPARAPGADGNASGVAVLLEALYLLLRSHKLSDFKNRVVFHFYAAGDAGLKGSLDIFERYDSQNVTVAAMLNQDMAGSILPGLAALDYFSMITTATYEPLNGFLKRVIGEYCSLSWLETECGYACSDHAAATKYGFPASYITHSAFGLNPWKGSELDTMDKIRIGHMVEHVKLVLGYVFELGFADL